MGLFRNKKQTNEETEEESEEDSEEESEDENTYSYCYECDNCGDESEFDIPCGTRVEDYLKNKICETCECKILDKESSINKSQDDEQ